MNYPNRVQFALEMMKFFDGVRNPVFGENPIARELTKTEISIEKAAHNCAIRYLTGESDFGDVPYSSNNHTENIHDEASKETPAHK